MKKWSLFFKVFLMVIFLMFLSCNDPIPVNWNPTFDSTDKHPYGTFILKQEMPTLFPNSELQIIGFRLDDFLEEKKGINQSILTFIKNYPGLDSLETLAVRDYIKQGNIYFLAYENSNEFGDSIFIESYNPLSSSKPAKYSYKDLAKPGASYNFQLKDAIYPQSYAINRLISRNYFKRLPATAQVLGTIEIDGQEFPNFVKVPFHLGWYYLHAEPFLFTNIGILDPKISKYAADVLSFLPDQEVFWNNNNISKRKFRPKSGGTLASILKFAWGQPPLKNGILILLFAGIGYILFNSARRQNAIAYHPPFRNDLLDYSSSLIHTYKKSVNFKYLCGQKITYFLNMIRDHYYFTNVEYNDQFAQQLHVKSQAPLNECINLVNYINEVNQMGYCSFEVYKNLCDYIDQFYIKSKLYGQPTK